MPSRRLGLEQEFFIVEPSGELSNQADPLIEACQVEARGSVIAPDSFEAEWVRNILEIKTPPADSPEALAGDYLEILRVAMAAADSLGLRIYPLASYPLHLIPTIRDAMNNHVQVRTVGHERFLNAGRCTGVHVHIEVPSETIDPIAGIRYDSGIDAQKEVVNAYNLGTALDPVMIALGRSCPFHEGKSNGLAHHTSRYRGSSHFGWDGVYTQLQEVGGLRPYAESTEHLVHLQFDRHFSWLQAMDEAGVERELFCAPTYGLLKSSWNPIRLNVHGTIEHRNIDSNLPSIVLGLTLLLSDLHAHVRERGLTVTPDPDVVEIVEHEDRLLVPDHDVLNQRMLFAAVTEGLRSDLISNYTQSALRIVSSHEEHPPWLQALTPQTAGWQTTEYRLLEQFASSGRELERDQGLQLVLQLCDEFANDVNLLSQQCDEADAASHK